MDEDVLDRSVFASQRRLEVVDDFAAHEAVPKLVEMTSDVFLRRVAEQFKLGRICPQDFSLGADLVEAFECVLDEIRKFLLTQVERFFSLLASGFFGVKHAGLLLQQADRAKTIGLCCQRAIALGGQDRSMLRAYFEKQRRVGIGAEAVKR